MMGGMGRSSGARRCPGLRGRGVGGGCRLRVGIVSSFSSLFLGVGMELIPGDWPQNPRGRTTLRPRQSPLHDLPRPRAPRSRNESPPPPLSTSLHRPDSLSPPNRNLGISATPGARRRDRGRGRQRRTRRRRRDGVRGRGGRRALVEYPPFTPSFPLHFARPFEPESPLYPPLRTPVVFFSFLFQQ